MAFQLTSTAFEQGQAIPKKYTADGDNVSPPLKWTDPPEGTKALALVCEDPDAPRGMFTHWVIFNIPNMARELSEGIPPQEVRPNGVTQGKNDFGKIGYGGPSPPPGKPHRYFFKLYALNTTLKLPPGAAGNHLSQEVRGHVVGEAELMGTYGR